MNDRRAGSDERDGPGDPGRPQGPGGSDHPGGAVPAPPHPREHERLDALYRLRVLDGPPDEQLDRLTALAASLFNVPTALVSLVDEHRQWFLSRVGTDMTETPRDRAFCGHALHEDALLVVEDALADPRFATNPLVLGEPFVRFYAGVVLRDQDALPLGTLCLKSPRPRAFTRAERGLLLRLGALAGGELVPDGPLRERRARADAALPARVPAPVGRRVVEASTGALDAERFAERAGRALRRLGPEGAVAALVHLPTLERTNEIFGRDAGDGVLREVVARLEAVAARYRDGVVGRVGGARLALFGHRRAPAADPDELLGACETALRRPFAVGPRVLAPDLLVGVAGGDASADTVDALLGRCRGVIGAMASTKGLRLARHDELGQRRAERRRRIAADLGDALERDGPHLVCQPKFACDTGAIEGFECLLRWRHPELGDVPPPDIVEAAEDVNLVTELDRWVADRALAQIARWRRAGLDAGVVSINVTGATLLSAGFERWLDDRLGHHGVPATCVEIEVLETSVFDGFEAIVAALEGLRGLGVRLSLDDFGTGHSSLSYLRRLPVSVLKIDRSFVSRLERGPSDVAMCVGILALARSLGLAVVAEGVENERQLAILRSRGCDAAQGYHLSRPVPFDAATRLLESRRGPEARRAA